MSEYWKSTPKYWCKHCSTYVRDTKLERQNHEATAKHQGALKRFLRDLHRNHEQEQREKERAKREIERLNGVVSSTSSNHAASNSVASSSGRTPGPSQAQATSAQRQQQWEQLAQMGIDVPTELRGDMAMTGEWTVTNSRVIDDTPKTDTKSGNVDAIASGVRKRPKGETEEKEEEDAIKGLFKKPRRWGRDSKEAPEDDAELDALLSGTLSKLPKTEEKHESPLKKEDSPPVKEEDSTINIKKEDADESQALPDIKPAATEEAKDIPIKQEGNVDGKGPAVVFKKRKPKNIRQR
ncbi:uncharacterized protein F4822DRAFT_274447 [Hypoxylon trugodes]|uniref:uncharacterized protein n=1 Tax=Hypoxylon trugodes TaxID=326681 RepID=UPI0021925343|nr:uncharacterized protein F4822DRAFT_274447 [Hypoxylon trugodes]KAI1387116.1 hypothetical protein F4822DRAFT_274447 [Hypoxylon trugodes]